LNEPIVTAFVALEALPWALARNDFANALRFVLELRDTREHTPKPGDSELAQYVFLIAIQLCRLLLTNPQDARDRMSSISGELREVTGELDALVLAELLAAASRTDNADEMNEFCQRTSPGTAVWAMALLLRASSSTRSTLERATDQVTLAPHVVARASLWTETYARVVLTFFEAFWQHEISANAFRFHAPANLRQELQQLHTLPPARRLQRLLQSVSDALDLNLSREFREWFRNANE
jgi:hypothetical protein